MRHTLAGSDHVSLAPEGIFPLLALAPSFLLHNALVFVLVHTAMHTYGTYTYTNANLTTTMPPILQYYSRAAPTHFSAWMSGPPAYLYSPQARAPSHRAQVFTQGSDHLTHIQPIEKNRRSVTVSLFAVIVMLVRVCYPHVCLTCATVPPQRLAPPRRRQQPCPHACTVRPEQTLYVRPHDCLHVLPRDLYRDLMFDSLQEAVMPDPLNKGFVKSLHEQCAQIGTTITLADLGLLLNLLATPVTLF